MSMLLQLLLPATSSYQNRERTRNPPTAASSIIIIVESALWGPRWFLRSREDFMRRLLRASLGAVSKNQGNSRNSNTHVISRGDNSVISPWHRVFTDWYVKIFVNYILIVRFYFGSELVKATVGH